MKGQVTIGDGPGVYFTLGMGLDPWDPPSLATLEDLRVGVEGCGALSSPHLTPEA